MSPAMPADEQALALRWPCGCIFYADAAPSRMNAKTKREVATYIAEGAEAIRGTSDELRQLPNFLVHCPHRAEREQRKRDQLEIAGLS